MKPLFVRWDVPLNPFLGHVYRTQEAANKADIRDSLMTIFASANDNKEAEKTKTYLTMYFEAANIAVKDLHNMEG